MPRGSGPKPPGPLRDRRGQPDRAAVGIAARRDLRRRRSPLPPVAQRANRRLHQQRPLIFGDVPVADRSRAARPVLLPCARRFPWLLSRLFGTREKAQLSYLDNTEGLYPEHRRDRPVAIRRRL